MVPSPSSRPLTGTPASMRAASQEAHGTRSTRSLTHASSPAGGREPRRCRPTTPAKSTGRTNSGDPMTAGLAFGAEHGDAGPVERLDVDLGAQAEPLEPLGHHRTEAGVGVEDEGVVGRPGDPHVDLDLALRAEQQRLGRVPEAQGLEVLAALALEVGDARRARLARTTSRGSTRTPADSRRAR